MKKHEENLMPLILDFSEEIKTLFNKDGEQVNYGFTTHGTWDDADAGGTD